MDDRLTYREDGLPFAHGINGNKADRVEIMDSVVERLAELEDAEERRSKGCEYCGNDCVTLSNKNLLLCNGSEVYINQTTLVLFENERGDSKEKKINFCPMCGRKLSEVHNAKK